MKTVVGGVQWAVFLIASSIAAPIAIAHVFGMDTVETALFIQRTMFVLGIACLIQVLIGHRLPINEGQLDYGGGFSSSMQDWWVFLTLRLVTPCKHCKAEC